MTEERIFPRGVEPSDIEQARSTLLGVSDADLYELLASKTWTVGARGRRDEAVDFISTAIEALSRSTGRRFDTDFVAVVLAMIDGPVLDRTEAHPGMDFELASIVPIHVHVAAGHRVHVFACDTERAAYFHEIARHYFDRAGISSAHVEPWRLVNLMDSVPEERRHRYMTDVVYGSYDTLIMDSLRMAPLTHGHFLDDRHIAFVEEIDTILIKSGDSVIRITGPAASNPDRYAALARWVQTLDQDLDYRIDEDPVRIRLTPRAMRGLWDYFGITEQTSPVERMDLAIDAELSVRANRYFVADVDYQVVERRIVPIIGGALPVGSQYEAGLHQALAARENLIVEERQKILETANVRVHFRKYAAVCGGCRSTVSYGAVLEAIFGLKVADLRAPEFRGVDAQYSEIMEMVAIRGVEHLHLWDGLAELEERYWGVRATVSPHGGSPSDIVELLDLAARGLSHAHRVFKHSVTLDSLARRYRDQYAEERTEWRVACAEAFRSELDVAWSDHVDFATRMRESFPDLTLSEFKTQVTTSFEIHLSNAVIRAFGRIFNIRL
ncbi:hypothetical protein [Embleya sp. NPDC020630]|uniref:preprotein translocase subunit SecA n=1 Tax=Embleya sp. NPDC020630 TaxID=3363979 RepID=UPI0037B09FD0